jgi:isoleucyl-tRNA synthetase
MTYAILRQAETGKVVVVAKDLVSELQAVLGETAHLADVPGTDLVGLDYHPLFSSLPSSKRPSAPLRILSASYVTASSGTGLVHLAPAHGGEDYATFRSLNLPAGKKTMLCHVDDKGRFTTGVHDVLGEKGEHLVGQDVLDNGSKTVVALLKEAGALLKIKRIKHKYPYDWKTKEPIIMRCAALSGVGGFR